MDGSSTYTIVCTIQQTLIKSSNEINYVDENVSKEICKHNIKLNLENFGKVMEQKNYSIELKSYE